MANNKFLHVERPVLHLGKLTGVLAFPPWDILE